MKNNKMMSLDFINPAFLSLIGGSIVLIAAFLTYVKQGRRNEETAQLLKKNVDLMQAMAARTGDEQMRNEVIELRTRLLSENTKIRNSAVDEMLARIPKMTEDYTKLAKENLASAQAQAAEFEIKWKPVIRTVVGLFDEVTSSLEKKGQGITVRPKGSDFAITKIGVNNRQSREVRRVEKGRTAIVLEYTNGGAYPGGVEPAELRITCIYDGLLQSVPLRLQFTPDQITFGSGVGAQDNLKVERDGSIPTAFMERVSNTVNEGFTHFLVIANAQGSPQA
jgi:hypothetical protein